MNKYLEALQKPSTEPHIIYEQERVDKTMALQHLVSVMRDQVVNHGIDKDTSFTNWPKEIRRYEAFFQVPDENAVFLITSNGLPENERDFGLSLSLWMRDTGEKRVVNINTPNAPRLVSEKIAVSYTNYTPRQLTALAEIVRTGEVITKEAYRAFVLKK